MSESDEAERRLGRVMVVGLPLVGVGAAIVVGWRASFGSSLLVLASTALLSTVGLLWASLRTLSGDAPLPSDLAAGAKRMHREGVDALSERKRRVMRALKDLENERALGKIDEADYGAIALKYREEAKAVMREMEAEVAPGLAEAERIAGEYLKGRAAPATIAAVTKAETASPRSAARVACAGCGASNEPDAAFCKGCGARLNGAGPERSHAKA
jgi:hypothetical protein